MQWPQNKGHRRMGLFCAAVTPRVFLKPSSGRMPFTAQQRIVMLPISNVSYGHALSSHRTASADQLASSAAALLLQSLTLLAPLPTPQPHHLTVPCELLHTLVLLAEGGLHNTSRCPMFVTAQAISGKTVLLHQKPTTQTYSVRLNSASRCRCCSVSGP